MYSTNSSIVSALYISPPLVVGSTKGVLPENVRNSAHRSSAVERRRLSAASLARAWNDARSASTRRACSVVGSPRSHSSPLLAPRTPVSPSSAALAHTLSARAVRVFPAACPRIAIARGSRRPRPRALPPSVSPCPTPAIASGGASGAAGDAALPASLRRGAERPPVPCCRHHARLGAVGVASGVPVVCACRSPEGVARAF
eukprot:91010-Pleurochrysis_carterae.AAC.1